MTVHVIGNVTEDLVYTMPRLPIEGETVIATSRRSEIGGKGMNQALILARAGCAVRLVAAIGADTAGNRARALVMAEIGECDLITVEAATDQSLIFVAANGDNHIVSSALAADALTPARLAEALSAIRSGDTVLVQGNLGHDSTLAILQRARAAGAQTVANPSPIRWSWGELYRLIDLAIVNTCELADLGGTAPIDGAIAALRSAGLGDILVTLGGQGACLHARGGPILAPAVATRLVDTAGAGDTFCGVYLAASLRGLPPARALRAAARAAALTVSRPGTQSAFPSRAEIDACLRQDADTP